MKLYSTTEHSVLAFEEVISKYQELVSTSGMMSCMNYETNSGGKATHTGRTCVVTPSRSDTICDIEISARRCLSPGEWAYFKLHYKSCSLLISPRQDQLKEGGDRFLAKHIESFPIEDRERMAALDLIVRQKVGARLIEGKIFPLSTYGAPVDTSKSKQQGKLLRMSNGRHMRGESKAA